MYAIVFDARMQSAYHVHCLPHCHININKYEQMNATRYLLFVGWDITLMPIDNTQSIGASVSATESIEQHWGKRISRRFLFMYSAVKLLEREWIFRLMQVKKKKYFQLQVGRYTRDGRQMYTRTQSLFMRSARAMPIANECATVRVIHRSLDEKKAAVGCKWKESHVEFAYKFNVIVIVEMRRVKRNRDHSRKSTYRKEA